MRVLIDGEIHDVIYIEYDNGTPSTVFTKSLVSTADIPYWRKYSWVFFENNGDKLDIRYYNDGSGGDADEIHAPQFIDGYFCRFWIDSSVNLKGVLINAKRLKHPKKIFGYYGNKSSNPFKVAEITDSYEYCEECGHSSVDFCHEHKYFCPEDAIDKWKHNNKPVD